MAATSSSSYYTLLFTCTLRITIPCAASSPDNGKTIPIDKLCPQCAPHPHLIPVVFDQAHWDEMQGARKRSESVGTQHSQSASDKSETPSILSDNSKSSTKSKISVGFSRLRGLVRREESGRGGHARNVSVNSGVPQNAVAVTGDGEEAREPTKKEEGLKEKQREIKKKLDEVDREIVVEKVIKVEQALRALA